MTALHLPIRYVVEVREDGRRKKKRRRSKGIDGDDISHSKWRNESRRE